MDTLAFQQCVTNYYIFENMPDNVGDNWNRYICTDGDKCTVVEYDYIPKANEMVFFCTINRGDFKVELFKCGEVKLEKE